MDWLFRFLSFLQIVLVKILDKFNSHRNGARAASVAPIEDPLLGLSARQLAEKIREREISSEAVVKAYIDRIKQVNPVINAVVDERYEEALEDARFCDRKLESGVVTKNHLEVKMPLYGIPFTVKECISLKGLSHTGCTLVRRGTKSTADSPIVSSLKNAGAIPLCVTNTPEICCSFDAANLLYGVTRNPYDGRRTPGGSSGGEGALLGAGASLIGIGSDIAGSIRIPALFNGVYGHKPSPGIIPITGHFPFSDEPLFQKYLVTGPLTRYFEDLELVTRVMSTGHAEKLNLDKSVDVSKIKVFYLEDAGDSFGAVPVSPDIKRSVRRAAEYLESCCSRVSEAPIGSLHETMEITTAMFFRVPNIPHVLMNPNDPKHECNAFVEGVKSLLGASQYTKAAIFTKLLKDAKGFISQSAAERYTKEGHLLREKFIKMLGHDGVFLYPSFVSPAPTRETIAMQQSAAMYCLLANLFGFPATQVPMGLNKDGLPIGIQIIAAPDQDRLCLAVAKELDKRFGGWVPPPT